MDEQYEIVVVGAGPAGIIAVSTLLDIGVLPSQILWIDPSFTCGYLHPFSCVPANTKNHILWKFFTGSQTFQNILSEKKSVALATLENDDPQQERELENTITLLKEISAGLQERVKTLIGTVKSLSYNCESPKMSPDSGWAVEVLSADSTSTRTCTARAVTLATGSRPKEIDLGLAEEVHVPSIPLDTAMHRESIAQCVNSQDRVAVVGSSHSAVLALMNLLELPEPPRHVINIFRSPLRYAICLDGWTVHMYTGLKGKVAEFAQIMDTSYTSAQLTRVHITDPRVPELLRSCSKIIVGVGYEHAPLPKIFWTSQVNAGQAARDVSAHVTYNVTTSEIILPEEKQPLPRLFGFGIGFPEVRKDPVGNHESRIGLASFLEYSKRLAPFWTGISKHPIPSPALTLPLEVIERIREILREEEEKKKKITLTIRDDMINTLEEGRLHTTHPQEHPKNFPFLENNLSVRDGIS